MTPRERLLAVLERNVPDTVPIYIRGVNPFGDRMNWMGRHHPSYERLRTFVLENTDIFHGVDYDGGVFLSTAAEITDSVVNTDADWEDHESRIDTPNGPIRSVTRRSRHNNYEVMEVEFFIKDEADFDRFMSIPFEPVKPVVGPLLEKKDREVGERGLPVIGIPAVTAFLYYLFGSEGLALWSCLHREKLLALIETLGKRVLEYVRHLVEQGAGPLFSYAGPELAVPPLMSPKDFHELVTLVDKPVHDLIHSYGCHTWVHCHGTLEKVLEEFVEIGVDVLEPVEAPPGGDVTLADAKRRIGDNVILMGNMPYEAIISWPPERIEERVKSDCEAAMAGGGFIMMPAASPFEPVLTDEGFEGFKTYILSGRKYGRYT